MGLGDRPSIRQVEGSAGELINRSRLRDFFSQLTNPNVYRREAAQAQIDQFRDYVSAAQRPAVNPFEQAEAWQQNAYGGAADPYTFTPPVRPNWIPASGGSAGPSGYYGGAGVAPTAEGPRNPNASVGQTQPSVAPADIDFFSRGIGGRDEDYGQTSSATLNEPLHPDYGGPIIPIEDLPWRTSASLRRIRESGGDRMRSLANRLIYGPSASGYERGSYPF